MIPPHSAYRSRAHFGILVLLVTVSITLLRWRAVSEPRDFLVTVTRQHAAGQASDAMLASAQYHAAHAQRSFDTRWSATGYAAQALLGSAVGLALLFVRRRTVAG